MYNKLARKVEKLIEDRLPKPKRYSIPASMSRRSHSFRNYLKPDFGDALGSKCARSRYYIGSYNLENLSKRGSLKKAALVPKKSLAAPPPGKKGEMALPEPMSVTVGDKPRKSILT